MNYYNCCKSQKNRAEISLYAAATTTATNSVSAALCYCLLLYRAALAPLCSLGLDALGGVGPYIWPPEDLGDAQCFTSLLPLWATQMALETHQPASQRRVSATNPESTRFRHCLQALHTCDAPATQKRKVCVPLRQNTVNHARWPPRARANLQTIVGVSSQIL